MSKRFVGYLMLSRARDDDDDDDHDRRRHHSTNWMQFDHTSVRHDVSHAEVSITDEEGAVLCTIDCNLTWHGFEPDALQLVIDAKRQREAIVTSLRRRPEKCAKECPFYLSLNRDFNSNHMSSSSRNFCLYQFCHSRYGVY